MRERWHALRDCKQSASICGRDRCGQAHDGRRAPRAGAVGLIVGGSIVSPHLRRAVALLDELDAEASRSYT